MLACFGHSLLTSAFNKAITLPWGAAAVWRIEHARSMFSKARPRQAYAQRHQIAEGLDKFSPV